MGRIHTTHTLNAYTQHIHIHSTCRQMQRSQALHRIRIIYHASYTITPTRTYRHLPEMGCDQYHFNTTIHLRGKALHRICWIEGTGGLLVGLPSHTHSRSSLTIVGVQFTRCICVCVCLCVCVRARACVRACVLQHKRLSIQRRPAHTQHTTIHASNNWCNGHMRMRRRARHVARAHDPKP